MVATMAKKKESGYSLAHSHFHPKSHFKSVIFMIWTDWLTRFVSSCLCYITRALNLPLSLPLCARVSVYLSRPQSSQIWSITFTEQIVINPWGGKTGAVTQPNKRKEMKLHLRGEGGTGCSSFNRAKLTFWPFTLKQDGGRSERRRINFYRTETKRQSYKSNEPPDERLRDVVFRSERLALNPAIWDPAPPVIRLMKPQEEGHEDRRT